MANLTIYERRQSLSELLRKQPILRVPELANKLGKEDLTSFATIERIHQLFTDYGLTDEWRARLLQAGISFTICGEDDSVLK